MSLYEIVVAGGWAMIPILLSSVIATAIIGERLWALQNKKVIPRNLVTQIWQWIKANQLTQAQVEALRKSSPLGRVLAAGLTNQSLDRYMMKERIEETGRQVVHELERYVNTLGTIAVISPLLGLLGTVSGMMKIFDAIGSQGMGNPAILAGGIGEALITTLFGLGIAIPSLVFYRYFRGKVEELVVYMEQEALKMVELLHRRANT